MNLENDYIYNLIDINKNLRTQLEQLYKLIRIKLKLENNSRLENILNEMEILKASLSFSMQKQSNLVKSIKNIESSLKNEDHIKIFLQEKENKLKTLENLIDQYSKENMLLIEKYQNVDISTHNIKIELENKISEIEFLKKENFEFSNIIEEEKTKNKNLINLIKDLEKKKSNAKLENECLNLKEENFILCNKIKEMEIKFKSKLEKKDMIIKKLDESLVDYEDRLNNKNM